MPLFRLSPKAVDENKCPLGVIGRDVNRRKPYQRICRNAHFMPVKIEIDVHEESLHEADRDVNLEKQKPVPELSGTGRHVFKTSTLHFTEFSNPALEEDEAGRYVPLNFVADIRVGPVRQPAISINATAMHSSTIYRRLTRQSWRLEALIERRSHTRCTLFVVTLEIV